MQAPQRALFDSRAVCCVECLLKIGDEIPGILEPDRKPDQSIADSQRSPRFRRQAGVRHDCRVLGKRLDATEALRACEHAEGAQKGPRLGERSVEIEGDHPPRAFHLTRCEIVPGV